jgi:predicted deacylase
VLVEIGDQVALDQVVARLAAVEAEADAGVETPASKDGTAIEAVTEEERA